MKRSATPSRAQRAPTPTLADQLRTLVAEGLRYQQYGSLQDAADCYERALRLDSKWFDALQLLGVLRFRGGAVEVGIKLMRRALAIEPNHAPTLNNFGNALRAAGRWHEAIAAYRRALANTNPPHPMMLRNLGSALVEIGEYNEAAVLLGQARALDDRDAELHCWIGHLGRGFNLPVEAIGAYSRAVALNPSLSQAYRGLGSALRDVGRHDEALDAYRQALKIEPGLLPARVFRANLALSLAAWQDWEADRQLLLNESPNRLAAVDPFSLFYVTDSRAVLRRYADAFANQTMAQAPRLAPSPRRSRDPVERIRIAYVSGDIREHPVAHLTAGMFKHHDRSRFEIRVYAIGDDPTSPLRQRIAADCENYISLLPLSDAELAQRLQADENDIVVDLMGYTQTGRPRLLAARPAPVQVGWLGYPGTLGGPFMDYLIADEFTVAPGTEGDYAERIVRLPETFQPNDRERLVAEPLSRSAYGLPEAAFVLCSFNHAQKINPPLFDVWMQILRSVPNSVLWLTVRAGDTVLNNLRREATARGVDPERLVFAQRVPSNADHLARYRVADIALDTFPYGSHTTASDALWAGCPLVGLAGESLASRVSGSILRAAGLPELAADSFESYRELVVSLANDRSRLREIRERLAANRLTCPLFDTPRFVRALEAAYQMMHERAQAGLSPTHLRVARDRRDPQ